MQHDGRLPRARPALDDQRTLRLSGDQPVLVGLDRRDDVAHPPLAPALQLLQQEVRDGRALDSGAVERLVGDVGDAAPFRPVAAPLRDNALRILRRRRVQRPRRRCLPVDHQHLVRVVVHPAPADVERPQGLIQRQPARSRAPALTACWKVRIRRFAHASITRAAASVAIAFCVRVSVSRILRHASRWTLVLACSS